MEIKEAEEEIPPPPPPPPPLLLHELPRRKKRNERLTAIQKEREGIKGKTDHREEKCIHYSNLIYGEVS